MTLSRGFEIVVISLNTDEDSLSIFEALNAGGTPLTQADLVKNLVFQKLEPEGADIRKAYEANWRPFDESFWASEDRLGRFKLPQVSLFLNHWLVAQTGEKVRIPAIFARFKHWLKYEISGTVIDVVRGDSCTRDSCTRCGSPQRTLGREPSKCGLFFYRSLAAGTRAATPLVLWLFDTANDIPRDEAEAALHWFERWVVRRAVLGLIGSGMSRSVAQLLRDLREPALRTSVEAALPS
jgi:hypothetical protein